MKTTLEIPDSVFRRAKARAAERGIPLRQFVTEAVEEKLTVKEPSSNPWMKMVGGLQHLRRETTRVNRLIEESLSESSRKTKSDSRHECSFCSGRGTQGAVAELAKAQFIAIPVIGLGEFRFGIAQSRRHLEYERWLTASLQVCRILEVSSETATCYVEIRSEVKRASTPHSVRRHMDRSSMSPAHAPTA